MSSSIDEIKRCRRCGGMLACEEGFDLSEACTCPGRWGERARARAIRRSDAAMFEDQDREDLYTLMSDSGRL